MFLKFISKGYVRMKYTYKRVYIIKIVVERKKRVVERA